VTFASRFVKGKEFAYISVSILLLDNKGFQISCLCFAIKDKILEKAAAALNGI